MLWVWIYVFRILIRARCTALCDEVCQWLGTGLWFSLGSPVSSTNKTDCHDIIEILLKVVLNTIKQIYFFLFCRQVIMILTQLERTSPFHVSRRLLHRMSMTPTGLGNWAPPGVNHEPYLTLNVESLHAPRPL
jgi:hypothetical protein